MIFENASIDFFSRRICVSFKLRIDTTAAISITRNRFFQSVLKQDSSIIY